MTFLSWFFAEKDKLTGALCIEKERELWYNKLQTD